MTRCLKCAGAVEILAPRPSRNEKQIPAPAKRTERTTRASGFGRPQRKGRDDRGRIPADADDTCAGKGSGSRDVNRAKRAQNPREEYRLGCDVFGRDVDDIVEDELVAVPTEDELVFAARGAGFAFISNKDRINLHDLAVFNFHPHVAAQVFEWVTAFD